jgi:hypothetical protein
MPELQHNEPTNIIIQKPNVVTLAWVLIDIILSKKPMPKSQHHEPINTIIWKPNVVTLAWVRQFLF